MFSHNEAQMASYTTHFNIGLDFHSVKEACCFPEYMQYDCHLKCPYCVYFQTSLTSFTTIS